MKRIFFAKLVLSACFFCLSSIVYGYDHLPYFDGFEDDNAIKDGRVWKLNPGPAGNIISNKWYIGADLQGGQYMGKGMAFISCDGGNKAVYKDDEAQTAVMTRTFLLPVGQYDLSFFYRAGGDGTNDGDGLHVYLVSKNMKVQCAPNDQKNQPYMQVGALSFDGKKILSPQKEWRNVTTAMKNVNTDSVQLVFVWQNNALPDKSTLSALIDNVQIGRQDICNGGRPRDVRASASGTDVNVTWKGGADEYQVMYRAFGVTDVDTVKNISQQTSCTIRGMKEGVYDIFVRGISGSDTTIWTVEQNIIVYDEAAHCINFIDFLAPGTVCETGFYNKPEGSDKPDFVDMRQVFDQNRDGKIDSDHGYDSDLSQHTVHFVPGETDARTGDALRTVPDGSVVSVRLGNWASGWGAEAITYDIPLEKGSKKLLTLKYAVVLNDPMDNQHDPEFDNPRFKLELFDQYGNLLDPDCGTANFVVGTDITANEGWKEYDNGNEVIRYKDWTTIGFNLSEYARYGDVKIRAKLTSSDCALGGHYGYAYFTLDCAEAVIEGLACGEQTVHEVAAPIGFNYEWTRIWDGKFMGNGRVLTGIENNDTATYRCLVSNIENPECFFTLDATMLPRNPRPRFSPLWMPKNCTDNDVLMRNASYVETVKGVTGERCETFYWYLDDELVSTEEEPLLTFPNEGGKYNIKLVAGLADDACQNVFDTLYTVRKLMSIKDTIMDTVCRGGQIKIDGQIFDTGGLHLVSSYTGYGGCDSTVWLDLHVIDIRAEYYDTICWGEYYELNGDYVGAQRYTKSDTLRILNATDSGCDSLTVVYLHVRDRVDAELGDLPVICAGDSVFSVPVNVLDGNYQSYDLRFGEDAKKVGFTDADNVRSSNGERVIEVILPEKVVPDRYHVDVVLNSDTVCGADTLKMNFEVRYPDSILVQKFNDVIAVLNTRYNGGYVISSYQWYKNGDPIPDANGSYIYVGPDADLNAEDEYSVALVREGETTAIMSCPVIPVFKDNIGEYISETVVPAGSVMFVKGSGQSRGMARWWSISGQQVGLHYVLPGGSDVRIPDSPGVYMLELTFGQSHNIYKIFVK